MLDVDEECFTNTSSIENRSYLLNDANRNGVASASNELETVHASESNNPELTVESEKLDKSETIVLSYNTNQNQQKDGIQSDSTNKFMLSSINHNKFCAPAIFW